MKRALVVVFVGLTFMAVSVMSGYAAEKPMDDATYQANFFVTGSEGAAKQPISFGEIEDPGFFVGGSEGAARPGVNLGEIEDPGFFVNGSEGAARPGIQWPQAI